MTTSNPYETLARYVRDAEHIVFFTGAGASTESGAADFRSPDGVYARARGKVPYEPERMLSIEVLRTDPKAHFQFIREYMNRDGIKPNICHTFPVELEQHGKTVSVVTQNPDGLHQEAGSSTVWALHGNERDLHCMTCGTHYVKADITEDEDLIPRCPKDHGVVRRSTVAFGESLDPEVIEGAVQALSDADLLIVLGTSLNVYPAAGLVRYFRGEHCVQIDRAEVTRLPLDNVLVFQESGGEVIRKAKEFLSGWIQ